MTLPNFGKLTLEVEAELQLRAGAAWRGRTLSASEARGPNCARVFWLTRHVPPSAVSRICSSSDWTRNKHRLGFRLMFGGAGGVRQGHIPPASAQNLRDVRGYDGGGARRS
jgi:hypothetical protein